MVLLLLTQEYKSKKGCILTVRIVQKYCTVLVMVHPVPRAHRLTNFR